MKKLRFWSVMMGVILAAGSVAQAQTERAAERRADRAERRAERRMEQANYFGQQTWQEISPWIQDRGVDANWAFNRAARAIDAQVRANQLENRTDQLNAQRGQLDIDINQRGGTTHTQTWFGFTEKSPETNWFYDYYTVVPEYSYYHFNRVESQPVVSVDETFQRAEQSNWVTLEGEIGSLKKARVGENDHLVAKLNAAQGTATVDAVDLGPAENAKGLDLQVGDKVRVTGWIERIGDKELLVARSIDTGKKQVSIQRDFSQAIEGTVVDVKPVQMDTGKRYFAIVNTDNSKVLVDLGNTERYTKEIAPETKIVVKGTPVRTNGQVLVVADQVNIDGSTVEIQ